MNTNILRQIKDIQVQAEKLMNSRPSLEDIDSFNDYSREIKNYIEGNIQEEFILEFIKEIPDLETWDTAGEVKSFFLIGFVSVVLSAFSSYFKERHQVERSLEVVREIRGKYASLEFLMRAQ